MTAQADQDGIAGDVPPIEEGLFRLDDGTPVLTGSVCPVCNRPYYPAVDQCSDCLTQAVPADLGTSGTIYSHTTIRTRPPFGLPQPYSVAYLDLDAVPLRIFALLDPDEAGRFSIGEKVSLAIAPIGHDGDGAPRLRPYFIHKTI